MPIRPGTLHYPKRTRSMVPLTAQRLLPTWSKAWRAIRQAILIRDLYICADCGGPGNEVDHVDGNDANNDPSNLKTRCKRCHSTKTAKENGAFGNAVKTVTP